MTPQQVGFCRGVYYNANDRQTRRRPRYYWIAYVGGSKRRPYRTSPRFFEDKHGRAEARRLARTWRAMVATFAGYTRGGRASAFRRTCDGKGSRPGRRKGAA